MRNVRLEAGRGQVFRFAAVARLRNRGSAESWAWFRERFAPKGSDLLLAEGAKTLTRSVAKLEAACGPGRGLVSVAGGSRRPERSRACSQAGSVGPETKAFFQVTPRGRRTQARSAEYATSPRAPSFAAARPHETATPGAPPRQDQPKPSAQRCGAPLAARFRQRVPITQRGFASARQ